MLKFEIIYGIIKNIPVIDMCFLYNSKEDSIDLEQNIIEINHNKLKESLNNKNKTILLESEDP